MEETTEILAARELVQKLFVRHQLELHGFLMAFLTDFSAVDDVLQETFLTVSRKALDFDPETNFSAWAGKIARLHALEWRKKQGRMAVGLSEVVIERLCQVDPGVIGESTVEEELHVLKMCVDELSPSMRKIVHLRYQAGHRPAEVARHMGWTVEAIYVALSRVRATLRECVSRRLSEQGASGHAG